MTEYRLRPAARSDLERIWHETRSDWSERQADAYVEQIFGAFAVLAEFPMSGKDASDIRAAYRQQRCGAHVIFYRPETYGVEIVRVLHGRMLAELHL